MKDGAGLAHLREPVLFPETGILPEKNTRGFTLRLPDPDLNDLLDNNSIPDELKMKLYLILQRKYDRSKTDNGDSLEKMEDAGNLNMDNSSPRQVLNKIVAKLPIKLVKKGRLLADILMEEGDNVRWDHDGNITHPILRNIGSFDLKLLVRTIIYTKGNSGTHSRIASQIIRPFMNKLDEKVPLGMIYCLAFL